jgi:hypothetical protein
MKFSLEKAVKDNTKKEPNKRTQIEEPRQSKFMKISEIIVEEGPKPERASPKKLSPDAPVLVCIYKATDNAGDVWESYQGGDPKKLWQVQISHEVPRPITYQFRDRFADFIKTYEKTPDTLQELEEAGIRPVVADRNDPENVGFVRWRPCLYIVDDLNNGMLLLDAFFKHISEVAAKAKSFDVQITPQTGINIDDIWDDLQYENYTLNEASNDPPLKFFEAAPCYGKKVTTFSIEVHSSTELSIVITHVYAFRDGFEKHGVKGGRFGATANTKGDYVRLMPRIDVTKDEDRVMEVIEDVLHNVGLRVLIDGKYEEDSPVGAFFTKLRERLNVHF